MRAETVAETAQTDPHGAGDQAGTRDELRAFAVSVSIACDSTAQQSRDQYLRKSNHTDMGAPETAGHGIRQSAGTVIPRTSSMKKIKSSNRATVAARRGTSREVARPQEVCTSAVETLPPEPSFSRINLVNPSTGEQFYFPADILELTGTAKLKLGGHHCRRLLEQVWTATAAASQAMTSCKALEVSAAFEAIKPRDGLESMIAAQMVTTHALAMQQLERSTSQTDAEVMDRHIKNATRLSRTFGELTEVLLRYRTAGKAQRIRVTKVIVKDQGRAIIAGQVSGAGKDDEG
jgi:hypothetical protein